MTTFEEKSWVWIHDEEERYLPAEVLKTFKRGEATTVRTEDGEDHEISAAQSAELLECNPEALNSNIDDLINISDLNEMSILHNLRIRYKEDKIYTNVSSILISVNPFKLLSLYTPEVLDSYRNGSRNKPPHVFGVAYNAYSSMLSDSTDQSVVISGESGAGKSEATKLILQFLTDVSGRQGGVTSASSTLEQQILAANPILEAFGNAKTLRNNNSSRFGKLITVNFDSNGSIMGGSIINYLLEKSRVVGQSKGERNYHIFYQLLATGDANPQLQATLKLQDPELFNYTGQSGVIHIDGVSDEKEYDDVVNSMNILKFSKQEQDEVLQIVAGVLHFGNVKFQEVKKAMSEDACAVANPDALAHAAKLWGIDADMITKSLTSKNIGTRSIILVTYNTFQAQDARDAMCKRVYAELFQFMVNKINDVLASTGKPAHKFIGVLDIFGFESFDVNSFEQLCINYCNEKLQFHFNEHIFRLEQNLYASEGITISATDFKDNQPTLDLLEAKNTGIFSMCDEEISVPRGSDEGMLQKILSKYADGKHPNCIRPKAKECNDNLKCFGVHHYAGPVFYNVTNFLEKNKDQLHPDIIGVLRGSSVSIINSLFNTEADAEATKSRVRAPTVVSKGGKSVSKTLGAQFKQQLHELMATLNSTSPHFIRCMKPNDKKCGNLFTAGRMQDQLRYAGLVEVCRIRKLGYPVRREFDAFYRRYKCCYPAATNIDVLLAGLVELKILKAGEWAKGNSKIFLRTYQSLLLEQSREGAFVVVAIGVQKVIRRYLAMKKFRYFMKLLQNVKDGVKSRNEQTLTYAIDMSFELPWGGKHLKVIQDAKVLQLRLREENRVISLLQNAMTVREITSLKSSIAAATGMSPPLETPLIAEAREMLRLLEEEQQVKTDLLAAIASRDRKALATLLAKAEKMNMDCNETRQAAALKVRLEEEDRVLESLQKAVAAKNLDDLKIWISKCAEMGLDSADLVSAKALQDRLQMEMNARQAVAAAIETRELDGLTAALAKAQALGLSESVQEIAAGIALKTVLVNEGQAIKELERTTDARDLAGIEAAIARATTLKLTPEKCEDLAAAIAIRDTLLAENAARQALDAALAGTNMDVLASALAEANRMGLSGPSVDTARSKIKALGARSEALEKLVAAATSESLEEVNKALAEAETMGLINTTEAQAVVAKRDRLLEEDALLREIDHLIQTATAVNQNELSKAVANGMRIGLTSKYPEKMAQAKAKAKQLGEEVQVTMHIEVAARNGDLDALQTYTDKAKGMGMNISFAEKKIHELQERAKILELLGPALDVKDSPAVRELLSKADELGITGEKIDQARLFVDRNGVIEKTYKAFVEAAQTMNLSMLNSALETAIELGLQTPEVEAAQSMRAQLEVFAGVANELNAAIQVVSVKIESGIVSSDLDLLNAAIAKASKMTPPSEWAAFNDAKASLHIFEQHVVVREELIAALQSNKPEQLRTALSKAENLDMHISEVTRVKEALKGVEVQPSAPRVAAPEDQDYAASEKAREERKEMARQARFELKNFSGLRTPDDFAKGAILNKQSVKDKFLIWQGTVISKSLMDLSKDLSKVAVQIHKDLLGYMGDKHMPFPAMLAQDVLRKGYEITNIRDEIYLQIIKQLSTNPRAESVAKGWQLMCMCVSTFPPSHDFEYFLLHYILNKLEKGRGAVVDYAKYCLRTLEGMLTSGESSGFVPSVEEIQAYKERPPILATIELVDGQIITEDLPVTPDLNVGKVLEICSGWLDLKDARASTLGIFVYDMGELTDGYNKDTPDPYANAPYADLLRTPRPLRNEDFMGDVIVQKARQRRKFKFVLKKKIFLAQHNYIGTDPYYERLVYLQAEDEVIVKGNIPVASEDQVVQLGAISASVAFADDFPESVEGLVGENISEFIVASYRNKKSPADWAKAILAARSKLPDLDPEALQETFVRTVQELPYYGTHWFYVYKVNNTPQLVADLPRELILAFNADGMHIFNLQKKLLHSFAFADIYRWGGSSSQFSLIIWDSEVKESFEFIVTTAQAADMAAIILDHIRTIMAMQESEAS